MAKEISRAYSKPSAQRISRLRGSKSFPQTADSSNIANRRTSALWAIVFAAALTALWVSSLPLARVLRGQNDFLSLYAGAKFAGTPLLYSTDAAKNLQESAAEMWLPAVIYSRPPFYAAMLKPLGLLPYRDAYWLFQCFNAAVFAGLIWFWLRRDVLLAIIGGISIPIATCFANGQDVLLLVLICATAWELERRGKSFLSGLILPLLAIKFHLFVFVPLIILLQKRWRMLAGASLSAAILYVIAAFEQGWNWPADYLHFLRTAEITPAPITMPNLHGLLLAVHADRAALEWIGAACVAVAVIFMALSIVDFAPVFALAIVAGLLTSHHAYVQDACVLLLVPLLAPDSVWARRIVLGLLAPPGYFLLVMGGPLSTIVPLTVVLLLATMLYEGLSEAKRIELRAVKLA